MAGAWRGFNLITPSRLEAISRDNLLVGLDTIGRFLARTGSLTVAPDGTISGNVGGAFTGWITIGQAGAVFAHINEQPPEPASTLPFVVNAGLDTLATAMAGGDGSQEILLFVRAPTAASNANLKGYWRSADFAVPPRLTLETNSLGEAFSVQGARDFEFSRDAVSTGKNGEIIGLAEPFVGQVETRADGWVHVTGTYTYGEVIAEDLWTNAGQTVLMRTRSHEQQELTLVLKAPTSPEAEAAASK